jgi:tRNA G46 methylase TrmB
MLRCLRDGGLVRAVTDHREYFELILRLMEQSRGRLERVEFTPAAAAAEGELVGTNYERKYLAEGRDIYTVAAAAYGHSRCSSH